MGERILEWRLTLWRLVHLPRSLRQLYWLWRHRFRIGDIFIDGFGHPVVVTEADLVSPSGSRLGPWEYDLAGISLVDGTTPRSCSVTHSAPLKVSFELAAMWIATTELREQASEHFTRLLETSPALDRVWGRIR